MSNRISSNTQTETQKHYYGIEELFAGDKCLPNYNKDVAMKIAKHFEPDAKMLEFGSGLGTLGLEWEKLYAHKPDCIEIDERFFATLEERGFKYFRSFESVTSRYDGVYTSNVLEHIEDDLTALKNIHNVLEAKGKIAVFVPSFMLLYSEFDRYVGHFRRYSKQELAEKLEQAGFEVRESYYVDSIGFMVALLVKLIGKRGASMGSEKNFKRYDKLYRLSAAIDKLGARHCFGKNLLMIGQKR